MYVKTVTTDVFIFICNVIMCLTSHYNFQYHNQSVDTDNITLRDQRKNMEIILTILLWEIKEKIWKLYWQYYSVRSKEKYGNYTDNITLWDQRKSMEIILTILLCEIKGKVWKLYWQYYSVRSKEKYGNYLWYYFSFLFHIRYFPIIFVYSLASQILHFSLLVNPMFYIMPLLY